MSRSGEVTRKTKETEVRVRVRLDGTGRAQIHTGIGFFDHMLEALARHALFDLEVSATGDLHVDQHHTVEDVGIVLGQALSQALGERRGIRRYGEATVPLDDALARVVVDNVPSIQVDWSLYGPKLAQVALTMGADDVDGVSPLEGDLGRRRSPIEEIRANIVAAGLEPVERTATGEPRA